MPLLTKTHNWAMIRFSPVEVIKDADGEPHVFMLQQGEDEVGCMACDEPLNKDTVDTECDESLNG